MNGLWFFDLNVDVAANNFNVAGNMGTSAAGA